MMDDRFDDTLNQAADSYNEPPPTPRDEIWGRIQSAREARIVTPRPTVIHRLVDRLRTPQLLPLAAVLIVGVGIGLWVRGRSGPDLPTPNPTAAATPGSDVARAVSVAAAADHLAQVDAILTDYEAGRGDAEFEGTVRDLLVRTRLWLGSDRLNDAKLTTLLEDLELVLVQIAQLVPNDATNERALIEQGLLERRIRPRLRNAIPAGPAA